MLEHIRSGLIRVRTSSAQSRSFASIVPSLWNRLQSALPSSLVVYPHLSLTSKPVFSLGVKRTGEAYE